MIIARFSLRKSLAVSVGMIPEMVGFPNNDDEKA
jgi:hypothetical protein